MRNRIDEGVTYEYLVHGIGIMVIGFFFLPIAVLGIPIILLGLGVIGIRTGIEFDLTQKKMRKYKRLFGYTFGDWIYLKHYTTVLLKLNLHTSKYGDNYDSEVRYHKAGTAKTYDLILVNAQNNQVLFNPFLKFGLALKTLEELRKIDDLEVINEIDKLFEPRKFF